MKTCFVNDGAIYLTLITKNRRKRGVFYDDDVFVLVVVVYVPRPWDVSSGIISYHSIFHINPNPFWG